MKGRWDNIYFAPKQNSSECSNDSIVGRSTVMIVWLFCVNYFIQLLLKIANTAFQMKNIWQFGVLITR